MKGSDVQDVLAKRKYSELRDFTLHKHALGEKLSRMDDGLLGKVLAGYATNNMEEEEMSDDDNNYANFGDDTENDDENTQNNDENTQERLKGALGGTPVTLGGTT